MNPPAPLAAERTAAAEKFSGSADDQIGFEWNKYVCGSTSAKREDLEAIAAFRSLLSRRTGKRRGVTEYGIIKN